MKKKDFLLILIVCVVAVLGIVAFQLASSGKDTQLVITVDGEIYGIYSLEEDHLIEINGTNVCEIKNGTVSMTEADCPDQLCVHQREITSAGGTIVCLPNRVVLEISGNSGSGGNGKDATVG